MSVWARLVIGLVLVAGLGLFAFSIFSGEPAAPQPPPAPAQPETETAPARAAAPGVLDSSETCRACHEEIYAEWTGDRHAQAWVGDLYTELSKNHADRSCWACHAPRPLLETGIDSPAEERGNRRERGITCLTCHKAGNHVAGPNRAPADTPEVRADCGPVYHPHLARWGAQEATTRFCGICHNLHGTDEEFAGSRYYREGLTCLSCHMAETVSPVAKGGEPRKRRVHRFAGAHSPDMLRKALRLEPRHEGNRIVVRVVNHGAGHCVPTDARHRAVFLSVAFFDKYGQPVPIVVDHATGARGLERDLDLIRLFYRQEHRDPTQVWPDGTPGRPNWRESSVEVPEAARGGRARLRLLYARYVYWPREKGTLVEERTVPLDG